ncbi:hypothetical protein AAMO2058_001287300 [Amorphochlora amoebiformis]
MDTEPFKRPKKRGRPPNESKWLASGVEGVYLKQNSFCVAYKKNDQARQKSFSVSRYGEAEAKRLAIKFLRTYATSSAPSKAGEFRREDSGSFGGSVSGAGRSMKSSARKSGTGSKSTGGDPGFQKDTKSEDRSDVRKPAPQISPSEIDSTIKMLEEVEDYTFLTLCDNFKRGTMALDIECGTGKYTGLLSEKGATVTGVDRDPHKIKLAQKDTKKRIRYLVHDYLKPLQSSVQYDLVTCHHLLCSAKTKLHLKLMLKTCFLAIRPGGKFVAINDNNFQHPDEFPKLIPSGYIKATDAQVGPNGFFPDGSIVVQETLSPKRSKTEITIWSKETYESIMSEIGFSKIEWYPITLPPRYLWSDKKSRDFVRDWIRVSPIVGLKATKP